MAGMSLKRSLGTCLTVISLIFIWSITPNKMEQLLDDLMDVYLITMWKEWG
jgi:hypothetical protein